MYDERFMKLALNEAKKAYNCNEVPVGAVIVKDNQVISRCHNSIKKNNNVTNHAEIGAIIKASSACGDWRLNDCEMYVTLEPCPMCAGSIVNSRIKKVYIGTESKLSSNKKIIQKIMQNKEFYHFVDIEYINNTEAALLLHTFFENKR